MGDMSEFLEQTNDDCEYDLIGPNTICAYEILLYEKERRKNKEPYTANYAWVTRDGLIIPLNEMTDRHLENAINYVDRIERNSDWVCCDDMD